MLKCFYLKKKNNWQFFPLVWLCKVKHNNKLKHIITMKSLLQHKNKITVTNVCRDDTFKATCLNILTLSKACCKCSKAPWSFDPCTLSISSPSANSSFMNCPLCTWIYVEDTSFRIHFLQCQHQLFTDRIVLKWSTLAVRFKWCFSFIWNWDTLVPSSWKAGNPSDKGCTAFSGRRGWCCGRTVLPCLL